MSESVPSSASMGDTERNQGPDAEGRSETSTDPAITSDSDVTAVSVGGTASGDEPEPAAPGPSQKGHRRSHTVRSVLGVAVVAVTGVFIVMYALPDAPITQRIPKWAYNTGDVITLNQNWALFAPDPPRTDVQLDFVITDADGSVTIESLPSGPAWLPTARSERWRKVRERVTPTSAAKRWPEVLQWSVAQLRASGRDPQRVELRRRWIEREADNPEDAGTERAFTFARLDVPTNDYVVLDPDAPGAVKEQPADVSPDGRAKKTDQ